MTLPSGTKTVISKLSKALYQRLFYFTGCFCLKKSKKTCDGIHLSLVACRIFTVLKALIALLSALMQWKIFFSISLFLQEKNIEGFGRVTAFPSSPHQGPKKYLRSSSVTEVAVISFPLLTAYNSTSHSSNVCCDRSDNML